MLQYVQGFTSGATVRSSLEITVSQTLTKIKYRASYLASILADFFCCCCKKGFLSKDTNKVQETLKNIPKNKKDQIRSKITRAKCKAIHHSSIRLYSHGATQDLLYFLTLEQAGQICVGHLGSRQRVACLQGGLKQRERDHVTKLTSGVVLRAYWTTVGSVLVYELCQQGLIIRIDARPLVLKF